jgi:diacylglycerol O-acyltransferase / wax synthase
MTGPPITRIRSTDAFTLSMERDPLLRSTIVAVARFDRCPDWDVLVDRVERASRLAPTFRSTIVPAPLGLAPPRWVPDPDFDLGFHLRRVAAPAPRNLDTVLELARTMGMAAFDPARPLWELSLVEGLSKGQAALIMKVHHALTDGIGGLQLIAHVVDLQREPPPPGPMPPAPAPADESLLAGWRDALTYRVTRSVDMTRNRLEALPTDAWTTLRDPLGAISRSLTTAGSLARFVRPITTTLSPVMTERCFRWHYEAFDVPLDELRAAADTAGVSVNDAFLAAITGGLRRYHQDHNAEVDRLRVTMPISMRTAEDAEGGNRITLVRFEAPVAVVDPVLRMREIQRLTTSVRHERALPWSETVAGALNLLPHSVTGEMLKHVDFLASNVPGFPDALYIGGAQLIGFYPFGPTTGAAVNVTLLSYRGTCHIGVNTDAGAVPDPDLLRKRLRQGFTEVVGAAR